MRSPPTLPLPQNLERAPMCILLTFGSAGFGVSNLFFPKVIIEKAFGWVGSKEGLRKSAPL